MKTYIFGHKNPDTDSVCSAIAYSYLKNQLSELSEPRVLGEIKKEAQYVLDKFNMESPRFLKDIKTQVKDTKYYKIEALDETNSYIKAFRTMTETSINTVAITDENNYLTGIVTIKDLAIALIKGDYKILHTTFKNIINQLEGHPLSHPRALNQEIIGKISVETDYYKSIDTIYTSSDIVITGDIFENINTLIEMGAGIIIICSDTVIPQEFIDKANKKEITIIQTAKDTYEVSKLIQQCNSIKQIMKKERIIKLNDRDYLTDVREEIAGTNYRNYPVVDDDGKFLGFLDRKVLSSPSKKQVILVDHNEVSQSVDGLMEAKIVEILDHHKLGGITSIDPIIFINNPVGSTCTIVYQQFKAMDVEIPYDIAGLLISGILSDTLHFKSPTCTQTDINAVKSLNNITNLDLTDHFSSMYKASCSIEGLSYEDILYTDSKEFTNVNDKFRVSQFFTSDINYIEENLPHFLKIMENESKKSNYSMYLLAITDIIEEGSYLYYYSKNENFVSRAFGCEPKQGEFIKSVVSRKKQIVPQIIAELNQA